MVKPSAAAAATLLVIALCFSQGVTGFTTPSRHAQQTRPITIRDMAGLPSPEESAKALSEYMVKSHEEKVKAVRSVEEKATAEIQALKKEIADLKSSSSGSDIVQSPAPSAALTTQSPHQGSYEELVAKLISYQSFMSEYIVKANEQKVAAIKAAEAAAEKKFQERLLLLQGSDAGAAPPLAAIPASKENKLYNDRNAKVAAAAQAGKSRWGDKEVQRVVNVGAVIASAPPSSAAKSSTPPPPAEAARPAIPLEIPPEVAAADHGLRNDGGVGGPSLAERIAYGAEMVNGAAVISSAATPALPKETILYNRRNAMVSASASAGKSRWGEMEVRKATDMAKAALAAGPATATTFTPAVEPEVVTAADHGLRSRGDVGGPSLAERVNLGAQLVQNA